MAQPNFQDLLRRVGRLEHEHKQLQDRFDKLADRFALYWFDELKPPAFAVVLNKYEGIDENKQKVTQADLFVITQHLGKADITLGKVMITTSKEPKTRKWEPLILPKAVMDLLSPAREPAEEIHDGDTALTS